jgi:hypothetical protein
MVPAPRLKVPLYSHTLLLEEKETYDVSLS